MLLSKTDYKGTLQPNLWWCIWLSLCDWIHIGWTHMEDFALLCLLSLVTLAHCSDHNYSNIFKMACSTSAPSSHPCKSWHALLSLVLTQNDCCCVWPWRGCGCGSETSRSTLGCCCWALSGCGESEQRTWGALESRSSPTPKLRRSIEKKLNTVYYQSITLVLSPSISLSLCLSVSVHLHICQLIHLRSVWHQP